MLSSLAGCVMIGILNIKMVQSHLPQKRDRLMHASAKTILNVWLYKTLISPNGDNDINHNNEVGRLIDRLLIRLDETVVSVKWKCGL
jgi:hypothetical protein